MKARSQTKEAVGRLDSLEDFVAKRGAAFYGLPPNSGTRVLARETWKVPEQYPFGDQLLDCQQICILDNLNITCFSVRTYALLHTEHTAYLNYSLSVVIVVKT